MREIINNNKSKISAKHIISKRHLTVNNNKASYISNFSWALSSEIPKSPKSFEIFKKWVSRSRAIKPTNNT